MGSIFHVPLARATPRRVRGALARGGRERSSAPISTATVDYRKADYRRPVLLLMGSEQAGPARALAAACGTLVKIPMAGRANSLNLAVATGVMLFEIMRGRLRIDG